MPEVLPEDRTTPQPPRAPQPADSGHARDKSELRRALDADVTVVLPREEAAPVQARPAKPVRALQPGVTMHEYRIDGVLGEGGFGITYLATDVHLNTAVAIKEYLPQDIVFRASDGSVLPTASQHVARYQKGLDAFLVEARTLASFRHRSIVRVTRFFEANRTAYMVLEVENGEPFKVWWPENNHIGEKALIELLLPLLDGLAAVHAAGFMHRDIKPDNIQVRASDGSLVLLDFGSAGHTAAVAGQGLVVVTPGYAPIEQYGLSAQGPWTDLYALAATLYWAVSGKKPPDAETRKVDPKAYTRAVEAGRDVYGDAFLKAIDWALNTDPNKRPRSVLEFRRALCADFPASVQRFDAAQQRAEVPASADEAALAERLAPPQPRWLKLVRPHDWPLALKLALTMLAAAVLPMTVLAWNSLRGSVDALVQAESRYLQQLATQTAGDVSGFLAESRRLASALAADPAFAAFLLRPTEPARAALHERLQRLARAGAGVRAVMLLDDKGVAQAGSDARAVGTSHALRPYFTSALAGQAYTSSLVVDSADGATSVYTSLPVRGEGGGIVGAMVVRVAGDAAERALGRPAQQDARLTSFMVDADGVVLYHPHADLRYRSLMPLPDHKQAEVRADQRYRRDRIASMGEAALARALSSAQAAGRLSYASTASGTEVVAGYAPVAGHDWLVAVSADAAALRAPLAFLHGYLLLGALAITAFMAGVAWLAARRITRPLRVLAQALHDLRAGDYEDARVKAERRDELGHVGKAFNALSDSLRQRDRGR